MNACQKIQKNILLFQFDSFRFMSTSLSSLVDNLSEIYKKECKGCEEKTKIKSVCNISGLENNKLNYKCKECKKRRLMPIIN